MDKQSIMRVIHDRVESSKNADYAVWRIGLTHDTKDRYHYWKNPQRWLEWEVNSLSDAQDIESYFINTMGMQGGTGGDLTAGRHIWVYVF